MKSLFFILASAAAAAAVDLVPAQDFAPPPVQKPTEAVLKEINAKEARLRQKLAALRRQGVKDYLLTEVEIYQKAVTWMVRHNEFYQKEASAWMMEALDRGLLRAAQLAQGEWPWFTQAGSAVIHTYRSRIDGSIQPYAVTFPEEYGKDPRKQWRVDVVLHGRDTGLTEVKFLHQHSGDQPAPKGRDFVQLDIYGRGNNAYRWAGEIDVLEAIDHFLATERTYNRANLLDPARMVLRGFSMGGAGTWHLGLHQPDRWCVLGPGAGFTTTHGYVKGLSDKLPPYQEACLSIYDAVDYAENAADVPVVAYAGSEDPQLQAARNIETRLKQLGLSMTLLVAPGLKHEFPPDWRAKAEKEYAKFVAKGRPEYPKRVRFVTYTMRYSLCHWVEILGLEQHYQQARVDAEQTETGYKIKTKNIRSLHLAMPVGATREPVAVAIDGQTIEAKPYLTSNGGLNLYMEKRRDGWAVVLPERLLTDRVRRMQKVPNLQGPIDDAFMDSFLCVRGTGNAWHQATAKCAEANLKRFQDEWNKYFRGELAVKDDSEVTPDDIANHSLILFGDPASNSLIAQVLEGLPLEWTKEKIALAGKTVSAANHVPVLIYPSPLNTGRYVVLNSGHTFHAADFKGTNALLYPRLGDYALLKPAATKEDPAAAQVVTAGLFDDFWRIPKK
jgi:predicted esterase